MNNMEMKGLSTVHCQFVIEGWRTLWVMALEVFLLSCMSTLVMDECFVGYEWRKAVTTFICGSDALLPSWGVMEEAIQQRGEHHEMTQVTAFLFIPPGLRGADLTYEGTKKQQSLGLKLLIGSKSCSKTRFSSRLFSSRSLTDKNCWANNKFELVVPQKNKRSLSRLKFVCCFCQRRQAVERVEEIGSFAFRSTRKCWCGSVCWAGNLSVKEDVVLCAGLVLMTENSIINGNDEEVIHRCLRDETVVFPLATKTMLT